MKRYILGILPAIILGGYLASSGISSGTVKAQIPLPPTLVINEIDYDQPSTDNAEFIEIKNTSGSPINLINYHLRLINGSGGGAVMYQQINLPNVSVAPSDYYVVCGDSTTVANCDLVVAPPTNLIQNGDPDAIALIDSASGGILIDTVSYGGSVPGYTEGVGATVDTALPRQGLSRYPDGQDANNNSADFILSCSTPGLANVNYPDCANPPLLDSDSDGVPDSTDNCPTEANPGQEDVDGDGVGDACDTPECGNNAVETGEACDDGANNGQYGYCQADCSGQGFYCGDGVTTDPPEVCDGNSQNCTTQDGYSGTQNCSQACDGWEVCLTTESCGDGLTNGPEQCDDGNTVSGDGCSNVCQIEILKEGSLSGFVFYDRDKDGVWDGWQKHEFKMNLWKIFLDENANSRYDRGEEFTITKGFSSFLPLGRYSFTKLMPGSYRVCEFVFLGFQSSLLDHTNCQNITLGSGEDKTDVNFGNYLFNALI